FYSVLNSTPPHPHRSTTAPAGLRAAWRGRAASRLETFAAASGWGRATAAARGNGRLGVPWARARGRATPRREPGNPRRDRVHLAGISAADPTWWLPRAVARSARTAASRFVHVLSTRRRRRPRSRPSATV